MEVSDWIEHVGKGMPVSGDTFVLCRFRDGDEENEVDFVGWREDTAGYWNAKRDENNCWVHSNDPENGKSEIIAYRIVTP